MAFTPDASGGDDEESGDPDAEEVPARGEGDLREGDVEVRGEVEGGGGEEGAEAFGVLASPTHSFGNIGTHVAARMETIHRTIVIKSRTPRLQFYTPLSAHLPPPVGGRNYKRIIAMTSRLRNKYNRRLPRGIDFKSGLVRKRVGDGVVGEELGAWKILDADSGEEVGGSYRGQGRSGCEARGYRDPWLKLGTW